MRPKSLVPISRHGKNPYGDQGFALIVVLVFMLMVSAIVVPFALTARTRLMVANNEMELQRLSLLAEGLNNVLAARLMDEAFRKELSLNSESESCEAGGLQFGVTIQDQSGLIDLNAASEALLAFGFETIGLDTPSSERLSSRVSDMRRGAPGFGESSSSGVSIPFRSVSELHDFPELQGVGIHSLYGVFTVDAKRGTLNRSNIPRHVLAVVGRARIDSPAMVSETGISTTFSIRVTVRRKGMGLVGRADFIVEYMPEAAALFRRVSQMPVAELEPSNPPAVSCDRIFGREIVLILEEQS